MTVFGYFISPITAVGIITVGYNPVLYTTTEDQGFVVLNITVIDPPFGGTPRPFTLVVNTHDDTTSTFFLAHKNVIMTKNTGADTHDYGTVAGEIVQFNVGDTYQMHTVMINDDTDCEDMPNEEFYSYIALNSRVLPINVINSQSTVTIDDSEEAECSELMCIIITAALH